MIFASRAIEQSLGIFWVVTIGRGRWGAEMGKLLSALRALEGPPQLRMSPPPNTQVLNHPAPSADRSHPTQNQGPSHLGRCRMSWLRVLALCTKSKHAGLSCAVLRHGSSLGCPTCSWMRVSLNLWVTVPSSEVGRTTMPPRVWYGGRSDEHRALAHSMSIVQVNSLLNLL